MKKILLSTCLLIAGLKMQAQTFTLLANDPAGDASVSYVADIQSLYYSMDIAQDSIWFKVQTYNAMDPNGDVGLMFGLDTNMVLTDGLSWQGTNHSMKYDLAFLVFQDVMSPNYYGYLHSSSGGAPITTTVQRPDSFTFIINTRLSLLDTDGNFHLLFGSGGFDIASSLDVYDDVPNTGYLTVSAPLGINSVTQESSDISIYPNPADDLLIICNEAEKIKEIKIFNSGGKLVKQISGGNFKIIADISGLAEGIYFCKTLLTNQTSGWSKLCITR